MVISQHGLCLARYSTPLSLVSLVDIITYRSHSCQSLVVYVIIHCHESVSHNESKTSTPKPKSVATGRVPKGPKPSFAVVIPSLPKRSTHKSTRVKRYSNDELPGLHKSQVLRQHPPLVHGTRHEVRTQKDLREQRLGWIKFLVCRSTSQIGPR